jgi:hypothetical protein
MEEIITLINSAASNVASDGKSMDLAKAIFERMIQQELDPSGGALRFIKDEIRQVF